MDPHTPYALFPVFNCGVDWLTCTSNEGGTSNRLEDWAYSILKTRNAAGGQARAAFRLGFKGHLIDSMFCGRRDQEVMVQISGPSCTPLATEAIMRSTNVSRIDYQVTVWTEGEQAHLGRWTYNNLCAGTGGIGRPKKLALITGHPDGETLMIGSRSSAAYGRLYDKGSESKLGLPRVLWRYEVEWKGKRAKLEARQLAANGSSPSLVTCRVHSYYTACGVEPAFAPDEYTGALERPIAGPDTSTLAWFRSSVSVTVKRCFSEYGERSTLEALGLGNYHRRDPTNGD